jgi:hypothetical protein
MAIWFLQQGANMHLPDKRGYSARDMALPFVQKDLDGKLMKS